MSELTTLVRHFHTTIPPQYDNHVEVLKQKLQLLKSEFEKIKDDLSRKEDKYALSWLNPCPGSEYDEYFIV